MHSWNILVVGLWMIAVLSTISRILFSVLSIKRDRTMRRLGWPWAPRNACPAHLPRDALWNILLVALCSISLYVRVSGIVVHLNPFIPRCLHCADCPMIKAADFCWAASKALRHSVRKQQVPAFSCLVLPFFLMLPFIEIIDEPYVRCMIFRWGCAALR